MRRSSKLYALSIAGVLCLAAAPLLAQTAGRVLEGHAAFGDWRADRPGTRRLIRPGDQPPPEHAQSVVNMVRVVHRTDQTPVVPNGFAVDLFADGLSAPRRTATRTITARTLAAPGRAAQ